MEDTQTPPTGEQVEMSPTSLSDVLASRNAAPEPAASSGSEGGEQTPAPQPSEPAASPEPATPPVAATESPPAAQAGEVKPPKWYRDHMAQVNRERAAERAELERYRSAQPPQPRPQQQRQPPSLPDPLEDPGAYAEAMQGHFRSELQMFQLQTTLSISERFARQQHGGEAFEECRAWLSTKPDIEAWAIQQPDPWTAAFTQYNREKLSEEIGDDPNAWREAERARIRAEILAEQAGNPQPPSAAPNMRPPPPVPATDARAAAPRDAAGRFTGPTPMSAILKRDR